MPQSNLLDAGQWLLGDDWGLRATVFVALLSLMAAWEMVAPRRMRALPRLKRWPGNLGIALQGVALQWLAFPLGLVALAQIAHARGWGLLNQVDVPFAAGVLGSLVVLDLAIYLQHLMFHSVPALWRLHRVHHADLDFDVTTGARFHPFEFLLSMLIKMAVILVIGPPAAAVLMFEVLLNGTTMFNHSNVRLPVALDRVLRWVIVTPDMHRVHHSIEKNELNSNFGFNLSVWDRIFRTYKPQPGAGHAGMTIGVADLRDPGSASKLSGMLALPFAVADRGRLELFAALVVAIIAIYAYRSLLGVDPLEHVANPVTLHRTDIDRSVVADRGSK